MLPILEAKFFEPFALKLRETNNTEAAIAVSGRRKVVATIRNTTVDRIVAPTTTTQNAGATRIRALWVGLA